MNYYQHNIGDYRRDTSHLSLLEHGIYRQLLDWYYLDEKPIPKETQVVFRRLSAKTQNEQNAIEIILKEFFLETDAGWSHRRCDVEIKGYQAKANANRENGKLGGRPRKTQVVKDGIANGNQGESQNNLNQEPLTNNHKPLNTKTHTQLALLLDKNIPESLARDWLQIRKSKKATLTETSLIATIREANKVGYSLEQAITVCCENSWAGFKAEYIQNKSSGFRSQSTNQDLRKQTTEAAKQRLFGNQTEVEVKDVAA